MNLLSGSDILRFTEGLISARKQQAAFSVDLTVRSVSKVNRGGSLDFGGGEYEEASCVSLKPEKKTPEETYGWWKLESGSFIVRFNETIDPLGSGTIMILPHERLLAAGGSHAPLVVDKLHEKICVIIQVGSEGLAIKENARISKAMVSA